MRLFTALKLPSGPRREAGRVAGLLKPCGADVKWVDPQAMHLTLKFLGETPEEKLPAVSAALERACQGCSALDLTISGCGAFPSIKRPNVIWLGLEGQTAKLAALAEAMDREMAGIGFEPESRPFRPHLTLGRLRRGRGRGGGPGQAALTRELAGLAAYTGEGFTARQVGLIKSTLTPQGARYQTLHEISLA